MDSVISSRRHFPQPLWLGDAVIRDKTILVHSEQGFGDAIQFCRYVPLVAERAARVILEVGRPLRKLMAGFFGRFCTHSTRSSPGAIRCRILTSRVPILSLPLAFGTRLETIPSGTALPASALSGREELGHATRTENATQDWAGLVGQRGEYQGQQSDRSACVSLFAGSSDVDAAFVSLQKDVRADDLVAALKLSVATFSMLVMSLKILPKPQSLYRSWISSFRSIPVSLISPVRWENRSGSW